MSTSGVARRVLCRGGRVGASVAVVMLSAACSIDVTEYTPFARGGDETRVARSTTSDPVETASIPRARTASAAPSTVVVARGDTLYRIARKHRTSVGRLAEANSLARPYVIRTGQRLVLPDGQQASVAPASAPAPTGAFRQVTQSPVRGGVRVARGDTLYSIARRHGVDVNDLMTANAVDDPSNVRVGQELILPYQRTASSMVPLAASPEITGSVGTTARKRRWTQAEAELELRKVMSEFRVVPGQSALAPF